MLSLLRMDCRRLTHGGEMRTAVLTELLVLLFVCFAMSLVASPQMLSAMAGQGAEITAGDYAQAEQFQQMTLLELVDDGQFATMLSAGVMALFGAAELTSGFAKNIFAVHARRGRYVAARCVSCGIAALAVVVLYVAGMLAFGRLFGLPVRLDAPQDIAQFVFLKWLVCWGFAMLGNFAALLFRREGVAQLVAVLLGVCLLQASLDGFWGVFHLPFNLMDFTLYRANSLVPIAFDLPRFVAVAVVSLAWVAVYALLSLLVLKKRDAA